MQGDKGVLYKNEDTDNKNTDYDLQIPLQNTLVTFKLDDVKEADMLRLAATIQLGKIARMAE